MSTQVRTRANKGPNQTKEGESNKSSSDRTVRKEAKERVNKESNENNDKSSSLGVGADGDCSKTIKVKKSSKQSQSKKSKKEKQGNGSLLRSVFGKAKYLILAIIIPPFLNYSSLQREGVQLKPEGEMYDIGWGQKLFLNCSGDGAPTVILDAPTGMTSDVWSLVAPKIAQHTRVCFYDRAGLGFSERPMNRSNVKEGEGGGDLNPPKHEWMPFTVEKMVDDLNKLVTSSSQQPLPFILVGAEIGALIAQFYTHIYESEVYGMVMVNPLPDELFKQAEGIWANYWFNTLTPTHQTMQLSAATGLSRLGLLASVVKQPISGKQVPDEVVNRQKYLMCHPRHISSIVDEHYFINDTFSQMRTIRRIKPFPSNISVSILTGNYYDEQMPSPLNKAWAQAQQNLISQYFPRAQHLVVNGGDRHMCYRQPDSIVEVVMKMVKRWKRKM